MAAAFHQLLRQRVRCLRSMRVDQRACLGHLHRHPLTVHLVVDHAARPVFLDRDRVVLRAVVDQVGVLVLFPHFGAVGADLPAPALGLRFRRIVGAAFTGTGLPEPFDRLRIRAALERVHFRILVQPLRFFRFAQHDGFFDPLLDRRPFCPFAALDAAGPSRLVRLAAFALFSCSGRLGVPLVLRRTGVGGLFRLVRPLGPRGVLELALRFHPRRVLATAALGTALFGILAVIVLLLRVAGVLRAQRLRRQLPRIAVADHHAPRQHFPPGVDRNVVPGQLQRAVVPQR